MGCKEGRERGRGQGESAWRRRGCGNEAVECVKDPRVCYCVLVNLLQSFITCLFLVDAFLFLYFLSYCEVGDAFSVFSWLISCLCILS